MNLFAVKLPQIRNIFGAVTAQEFCTQMVCVAEATVDALAQDRFFVGHAGSGMLVGVVMGRARFNPEAIVPKTAWRLIEKYEKLQGLWTGKRLLTGQKDDTPSGFGLMLISQLISLPISRPFKNTQH